MSYSSGLVPTSRTSTIYRGNALDKIEVVFVKLIGLGLPHVQRIKPPAVLFNSHQGVGLCPSTHSEVGGTGCLNDPVMTVDSVWKPMRVTIDQRIGINYEWSALV